MTPLVVFALLWFGEAYPEALGLGIATHVTIAFFAAVVWDAAFFFTRK